MRKLLILFIVLVFCYSQLLAQKRNKSIDKYGFCGFIIEKKKFLDEIYKVQFEYLNLQENDTIVDIGSQSGSYLGAFSATMPFQNLHFVMVDIDSTCMNKSTLSRVLQHYDSVGGKKITNTFQLVNNTVDSLWLPLASYNKVWILNTLHEIPDRTKMIKDMYNILRPGGEVVILEMIPKKKGDLHGGCNMPLQTIEEWKAYFTQNGFTCHSEFEIRQKKRSPIVMMRFVKTE